MRGKWGIWLAVLLLWNALFSCAFAADFTTAGEERELPGTTAAEAGQTPALSAGKITVYNHAYDPDNPLAPMVYITKLSLFGTGLTLRVYDRADVAARSLMGEYVVEDTTHGFTVGIPVKNLSSFGGTVYVTMQKEGMAESEPTAASYPAQRTCSAELKLFRARTDATYKKFRGTRLQGPGELKAGSYYVAEVHLSGYHTVGSVTIPVRYNTDYLELVPLKLSGEISVTETVDVKGAPFGFVKVGSYKVAKQCGVLPGMDTDYEGDVDYGSGSLSKVDNYQDPPAGEAGEYPYINTETGLVKLELAKSVYGPFGEGKTWESGASVLRLVFRAKQNGTADMAMKDLLHFATIEDYFARGGRLNEDGTPMDEELAQTLYATKHPLGLSVALEDATLTRTPVSAATVWEEFTKENPVSMEAADLERLPESFEEKATTLTLPVDSIKVYNYTNAAREPGDPDANLSRLDENLPDCLVLSPSQNTGSVKEGDEIRVYGDSALMELLGSAEADSGGGVMVDLNNQLKPEGGKVYVTSVRGGSASSAVAFAYPPESSRRVTFQIYRTHLPEGVAQGSDPGENPDALRYVRQGEQFQIRIYFNDINDLMGYTFPIHFNTRAVQAANRYFQPIRKEGYMSEADFFAGKTPFAVGGDISELTSTELMIYYAQESEVPGLMELLGIRTREEWDRRKQDIGLKIEYGVTGDPNVWNGGLLFTGPREETTAGGIDVSSTAYPYVDNNVRTQNARGDGLVKLWSNSLTSPVSRLEREGGYHFMTLNFVGVTNATNVEADFRFATAKDAVYDGANSGGGRLCLSGPYPEAGRNSNVKWEVYSMEEIPIPEGTTVGGIVKSYRPEVETEVRLLQNEEVMSVTTVGGIDGGGSAALPGTADFHLEGIMPGTYTMELRKQGHAPVVIRNLKVEEGAIDLSQHPDSRVSQITMPYGDVDGDGKIGFLDRQSLLLSKYYGKNVTNLSAGEWTEARRLDLDGDGRIGIQDVMILMAAENYGKGTVTIDLGE